MDPAAIRNLEARLAGAMQRDRHRLRGMLRKLKQPARQEPAPADSPADSWAEFTRQLEQSEKLLQRRRAATPAVSYPADLPIAARTDEIQSALADHQVLIVCGETGSGKSTQLPKICLAAGRGIAGFIGHTQPRRIAARTIAARLGQELKEAPSGSVAYKIRFTDTVSPNTYVKLMTDGILLAETRQDRFLDAYDTLIIDEAHERSLNIDFLLGYLKRLLPKRRDFRLIITSATIDATRFAEHFAGPQGPAPIIEVSGRSYPVETRYRPLDEEDDEEGLGKAIVSALDELTAEGRGDVLVFLPTERQIREAARQLRGWSLSQKPRPEILPLYARLSAADQNRVFQAGKTQRIVLATNVAESSLTVPGIRYVVDTGTARISRYSPRSKVQRLPIEAISQASADQRQGRCGRVGPGICIRLYSEDDYLSREAYATPEIRRTNLAAVILQMVALKLGEVDAYPFLDPPRPESIRDGYKTLFELGAIDGHRKLTALGKQMSRLPVDPRIARLILAGHAEGCLAEILIIATALEISDPRERPADKQQAADESHAQFQHPDSDFLSLLKLWDFVHTLREKLSRNQFRKACRQNFLSFNRLREWQELHRQLRQLVAQSGMRPTDRRDQYDAIHRALLAGYLSNIALKSERFDYQAAGGAKSFLWPGSGVFAKRPQWVVAAEAVETSKRYLRTVARINPVWVESLAPHLIKKSHSDPRWSRKRGTVMANEKVTLFGLPVVPRRRVGFGKIDPEKSRQLFIEQGLVAGDVQLQAKFYMHNRALIDELAGAAAKSRSSDYIISDGAQIAFYEERLPAEVFDIGTLKRWLKDATPQQREQLQMEPADLVPGIEVTPAPATDFPETLAAGPLTLNLEYRYQPGEEDDGISVTVPLEATRQVLADQLDWGVRGQLEEKILALIRSLPKSLRRCLVPAPDSARRAVEMIDFGSGSFLPVVATTLSKLAEEPIPVQAFDISRVPPHLRIQVRVVNDAGEVVARGRDLQQLQAELPATTDSPVGVIHDDRWERNGLDRWDLEDFPEVVEVERGGIPVKAFPALIDRGDTVSLVLRDDRQAAKEETRLGVGRLLSLAEHRNLKSQVNWLPRLAEMQLFAAHLPYRCDLKSEFCDLLAQRAFLDGQTIPRSAEEFEALRDAGRERLPVAIQDIAKIAFPLWETFHQVSVGLEDISRHEKWAHAHHDLREQLDDLMPIGFLVKTPWIWLQHYPRFLRGMQQRIEKLTDAGSIRDRELTRELRPYLERFQERRQLHADRHFHDPELELYRWMLEEFRISLFCQTLGTSIKISPQRLDKQWAKVSP